MDNFIVSARKYRPATFVSVVGQSHITSTLKNAISRNQLAHAYLFCGPRGVGKTTCARIFAKAINCLDPRDAEACNECESCRAFNEGRSFNIHELDAASNNSVDDIRNLTDQVRIPPQIGRYSVYIIDEVHMLSLQAFNAFLKTLEEPPAHAVFILATTEKHKIIPTILSRCQTYDFNRIRVEDAVSYLKYIAGEEGVAYDEESLHIIARKADGGMRDALSMFDKVVSFGGMNLVAAQVAETLNVLDYDTYFAVTDHILAGDYTAALLAFDEVLRKGFPGQTFVSGLNAHFRDLLMCKNPQTIPLLEVTGSVAERYKGQAVRCGVPLLFEGINLLTATDASFRTATNQRLHVELGLMKLCGLGQKKNDDALTPGLPPLERRSATPAPASSPVAGPQAAGSSAASNPTEQPSARPAGASPDPAAEHAVTGNTHAVSGSSALSGTDAAPASVFVGGMQAEPPRAVSDAPRAASDFSRGSAAASPAAVTPDSGKGGVPKGEGVDSPIEVPPAVKPAQVLPPEREERPGGETPQTSQAEKLFSADQLADSVDAPSQAAQRRDGGFSFSGVPISALLNGDGLKDTAGENSGEGEPEPEQVDEQAEERLVKGCVLFAKELKATRPRLGVAFEGVSVAGNKVLIRVPNVSLEDEIVRNIHDMKKRLTELSGVRCPVEFVITVEADTGSLKPVKVEDRLRYLTEKNPLILRLRKELDLDLE